MKTQYLLCFFMTVFLILKGFAADGDTTTLKIGVNENGLYKLSYNDLTGADLDLSTIDPRTFKISNRGAEIPIFVQGEGDGVFDSTDYILFYGTAITDRYTYKNVYWMTVGGVGGQRMRTLDGTISGSVPVSTYFPATLHAEKDSHYWQAMPNGEGQDHWFWDDKLNAPESRNYHLTLKNVSTTADTAIVRVRLKGLTDIKGISPDHHTKIYLNGVQIDDQLWNGQMIYDHNVMVPHTYLNEGNNTIGVETVGDTGAKVDQLFVNWIEVEYKDTYLAEDDTLLFGIPSDGMFQFKVTGFTNSDVKVFDITDPANVMLVTNTTIVNDKNNYIVKFVDSAHTETSYLAQSLTQSKSPAGIEIDCRSSWKSPDNGADYLIITHEDFYNSTQELATHRNASGLRVVTVMVDDIYDEFNHGIFNPQAIRDFLSYAYHNWDDPAPEYVLLVGDAYQDYKDNLNTDTINYVPSQIIETNLLGETPSDNWFVLINGDDILPDMFIGRLPVQNISEAENIIDKIIDYEQNPPDDTWNRNVLLVADDDTPFFEDISEQLAGLLPFDYSANKVYVSEYKSTVPSKDILRYINNGSILVNYTGHGSLNRWGIWKQGNIIFDLSDIAKLENTYKLPIVTTANCLNGFFVARKTKVSLAEELLKLPERGAIAVWAPTGLNYPTGHMVLMKEFYKAIFLNEKYTLGSATTAAKIATYRISSIWGELVETFILFGDPAMKLGITP